MSRVREHDWFKSVSLESMVLHYPTKALQNTAPAEQEGEIWLDWSFIDFWKSNQYTIQRGLAMDPSTLASSSGPSAEPAMLINSLKDVIRSQVQEIDALQLLLKLGYIVIDVSGHCCDPKKADVAAKKRVTVLQSYKIAHMCSSAPRNPRVVARVNMFWE
ncbi:hypothetical protein EV424DRAFT_1352145 [Suillus variegatus]|nr:hypothetical protein EV424DRAFT_1352145 [Suillus variegatus]